MSLASNDVERFWTSRRYTWPLLALLVLNAIVYGAVTHRLATKQGRLTELHESLTQEASAKRQELQALQAQQERLAANEAVADHFWNEVIKPRDPGLTEAMAQIDRLARETRVRRGRTSYKHQELDVGLVQVSASFPVEGDYFDLVRFINRVERAPQFFLVEEIRLGRGAGGAGGLELSCEVSFFLQQDLSTEVTS